MFRIAPLAATAASLLLSSLATPALAGVGTAEPLSDAQLAAAQQVFVGMAECDMKQSVSLRALDNQPGHFELQYKKARYTLVPEPTTTGAVRLEDRKAGIVWLQIPAKSMLLNARLGRREVDNCQHAEQRAEQRAEASPVLATISAAPR